MNIIPSGGGYSAFLSQNRQTSFKGYYFEPPQQIYSLSFYNGIEDTPHRFFSSESLKHALARPDILGKEGLKTVGRRIFKDARLMEAEAKVYFENAKTIQKKFRYDNGKNPGFYRENTTQSTGKPLQESFPASMTGENSDAVIGIDYSSTGEVLRLKKYKDEKVQQVTYAKEFNRTGKINHVEFWESGIPKKIEIGKKNLPGSVKKTDKVFKYDENGDFLCSGMNVFEYPDGKVEMSNYVYPGFSDLDPDNIQRYAIKRTENPDKTVTYQGLMVFKGKQYWCYIPEVTFTKEKDSKPIFSSALVEFKKNNVEYYSFY